MGIKWIKKWGLAGVMCFVMAVGFANSNDVIDDIASCVRGGNTKELSKYFSSTVSMTLLNDEGIYSRVQAEIILRDFFSRNKQTGVTITHRLDWNTNSRFVVPNLRNARNHFLVSYKLTT